jgi:hypothetical protein
MADMKLRHAAALALVSWYLMIPPSALPSGVAYKEPLKSGKLCEVSIRPTTAMIS